MKKHAITIILTGSALVALGLLVRWVTSLDPITVLLAGTSLGALGLLVSAVRQARAAGDLDASTALVLGLAWLVNLPITVVVLSGGVVRRLDAARELVPVLPEWYEAAAYVSLGLVIVLSTMLLVSRLISQARRVMVHTAALIAILIWAIAWLASGLQGDPLLSLSGLTLLACLTAAAVLPRGRGACVGVGLFGVTLAAASGLLAAAQFEIATVPCRDDCVLGSALTGVLANENLLSTALVATLPFAYLGFRGRTRTWLVVYLTAMTVATGSRGAILSVIVLILALLIVRPRLDADHTAPARTAIAGLLVIGAMLGSIFVVQQAWTSTTFSLDDRPELWEVASAYREDSPLFGYGPDRWESLYTETGEIPRTAQHSTHNQWVDVVFNAGWVGAALLVLMIVAMLWSAGSARSATLIVLLTVFMVGATERLWLVGAADFVSFSLIALILLGPHQGAGGASEPRGAVPAESTSARPQRPVPVRSG